jgi:hypothetical protein
MKAAVHITHEAARKIGGIGAVLAGLCTTQVYLDNYPKTLFYGPLFDDQPNNPDRLGDNAEMLFSSLDNIHRSSYNDQFREICEKYKIHLVYGKKEIFDEIHPNKKATIDIILIGIKDVRKDLLDQFKFMLWDKFKFSCQLYEQDWDFEQYLRIALPIRNITSLLYLDCTDLHFFSHEYMGVCTCLNILSQKQVNEKIIFYAHEVSTARVITESLQGHDISFYNIINNDVEQKISLEQRFGSQKHSSRNELIKFAAQFDKILAVGDWVKKEYIYVNPAVSEKIIDICYNGIPVRKIDYEHKLLSRNKLKSYCETLFNFTPDVIMTHVSRLVISKAFWRDISLLEELDELFSEYNIKGFFIILSSLIGPGRSLSDIERMEKEYGWPLIHKENWPDLVGYENDVYWSLNYFNAKSRSIKGVFINQYGFEKDRLGKRFPDNCDFSDLRIGSDAEFGMSVYEPFGIAQIETVPYGGIAVLSKACGSAFLLEKGWTDKKTIPFHIIDFANTGKAEHDWIKLSSEQRHTLEKQILKREVKHIFKKIAKTDKERENLFKVCNSLSNYLEWDEIAKKVIIQE